MYKSIKDFAISIWEKIKGFFKKAGEPSTKSVKRQERFQIGSTDFYWIYLSRKSRMKSRKNKYNRFKAYGV